MVWHRDRPHSCYTQSVPEPWGICTVPLTLLISLSRREERLCALQYSFCPVFSLIHIVMSGDKMLLCFSRMKKRNLGAQAGSWHHSSFFKLLDQNSSVCKWDLLLCFKGSGTAGKTGSLGKKPGKWQTLMIIFSMFLMWLIVAPNLLLGPETFLEKKRKKSKD